MIKIKTNQQKLKWFDSKLKGIICYFMRTLIKIKCQNYLDARRNPKILNRVGIYVLNILCYENINHFKNAINLTMDSDGF